MECVIVFDVEICLLMQVLQKLHTSPPASLQREVLIKYTSVFESLQVRFFTLCGFLTLGEKMCLKIPLLSTEVCFIPVAQTTARSLVRFLGNAWKIMHAFKNAMDVVRFG